MSHAHLSPSGAHRSLRCPASLQAEALVPNYSSSFAEEGTRAHEAATAVLTGEDPTFDDDAMADFVASYVKLVREYAEGGTLLVEQKVDFSHYVLDEPRMIEVVDPVTGEIISEEATAFGTSDAVILKPATGQLILIDLKYGMGVRVDAVDNEQLMLYALGCLWEYEWAGPFKEIVMVIHQPRLKSLSEWVIPVEKLLEFAEVAKVGFAVALGPNPPFNPGPKQCKFCSYSKAAGGCKALTEATLEQVGQEIDLAAFEVIGVDADLETNLKANLKALPDEDLGKRMRWVELMEIYGKATRAELETRMLLQGVEVPGWKIVQGRQGDRAWSREDEVLKQLKAWRIKDDAIYKKSLISPTQAEKLFKGSPKRWDTLQDLITRSEGKPSVAPTEDARAAIKGKAVDLDAFEVLDVV